MTRRLVLVRHAKAVQGGASDIERELTERGRADAAAIGRWLAEAGLTPDRVVVSPSTRTRQTWELAAAALPEAVPDVDDRIYANTVAGLLDVVHETPADAGTLLIVGHNPSVEALATKLDDSTGDAQARDTLAAKYPTSGVAVFALDADWSQASTGRLIDFAVPRGQR